MAHKNVRKFILLSDAVTKTVMVSEIFRPENLAKFALEENVVIWNPSL
jgi:hypothetical protein